MLSMLGLLGGKTIGKYIAIGVAVVALVAFIGFGWAAYNKAIAKAAEGEIKLKQANQETEAANENTERVSQMYAEQAERTRAAQRLAHSRRVMAQEATAALSMLLNSTDFTGVNDRLCTQAARIQGAPVAGCGEEVLETGQASSGSDHAPSAIITESTIIAVESTLRQCADYIETVEGQE